MICLIFQLLYKIAYKWIFTVLYQFIVQLLRFSGFILYSLFIRCRSSYTYEHTWTPKVVPLNSLFLSPPIAGHRFDTSNMAIPCQCIIFVVLWVLWPGCLFRSVSGDYELVFWNPTTGDQVLDLEIMANIDWISQSCSISFETLGNPVNI